MRFAVAALALFAGFAFAAPQETVYTTEDITITSCAPSVTNCPARSHHTHSTPVGVSPVTSPTPTTTSIVVPPYQSSPAPSISVITITTCVPTTSLSTITLVPSVPPTGTVIPSGGLSPTGTTTTSVPPAFTGAASALTGSYILAAGAAAVAALLI